MKGMFGTRKANSRKSSSTRNKPKPPSRGSTSTSVYRLTVPETFVPGGEVQVTTAVGTFRTRYPLDAVAGQLIQITLPGDCLEEPPNPIPVRAPDISRDSPNVREICDSNRRRGSVFMVTIPHGVQSGQRFPVFIEGQSFQVMCPRNAHAGMRVRIMPHLLSDGDNVNNQGTPRFYNLASVPQNQEFEIYEIIVPPGVQPGSPFAIRASGVQVLVTCPLDARPGHRIRFKLPRAIIHQNKPKATHEAAQIKLSYDKDGWQRTIRASDMKFQWIRIDSKGDVETNTRFHFTKSAYVRKLEFRQGDDPRIVTGILSLVPATEAVVDSSVESDLNEIIVNFNDIVCAQMKPFEEKAIWFQSKCSEMSLLGNDRHRRIFVRRAFLLSDSVDAIMSLMSRDIRKTWRFDFINEPGVDAGGLAREWFQEVTEKLFDPDMGLWQSSSVNQMCMEINPASEFCCEDHLLYFRFLGRVMGKALFDRQLVAGHMVPYLYKHLLGWPITFSDLEMVDKEYFNNLKSLETMNRNGEDIGMLCLDFTTTHEIMDIKEEIELVKDGASIEVTNDNFPEYMEACLKYRMLDRVKPQLNELLLGFFDVIPEPLLTVFDFQEIELLMCGLPEIDLEDWMEHTEYSGEYDIGIQHQSCVWFWEVVRDFDQETKARLLQFVTGTSGVPSRGFGVLQGNDGNIRKFTLHGVHLCVCLFPRAHTCFNRLDLPIYESKAELQEKLKLAVAMAATGFDLE